MHGITNCIINCDKSFRREIKILPIRTCFRILALICTYLQCLYLFAYRDNVRAEKRSELKIVLAWVYLSKLYFLYLSFIT